MTWLDHCRRWTVRSAAAIAIGGALAAMLPAPATADNDQGENHGWYGEEDGDSQGGPYGRYPQPVYVYPPAPPYYYLPAPPPPPVYYYAPPPAYYGPPTVNFGVTIPLH